MMWVLISAMLLAAPLGANEDLKLQLLEKMQEATLACREDFQLGDVPMMMYHYGMFKAYQDVLSTFDD